MKQGRDKWLQPLAATSTKCEAEVMDAEDPLFILYTSVQRIPKEWCIQLPVI
jgi:acetyl-CoA synthetase